MKNLLSIRDRLENRNLTHVEKLQRESFLSALRQMNLHGAKALSVSCGDGIWDYLALSSNVGIHAIEATDIVGCPVKQNDIKFLRSFDS